MSGQDQADGAGMAFADLVEQRDAVHPRHAHVGHDHGLGRGGGNPPGGVPRRGATAVPVAPPGNPALAQCAACRARFPIVPVDERTVNFGKLMTAGGKAAVDPNFV